MACFSADTPFSISCLFKSSLSALNRESGFKRLAESLRDLSSSEPLLDDDLDLEVVEKEGRRGIAPAATAAAAGAGMDEDDDDDDDEEDDDEEDEDEEDEDEEDEDEEDEDEAGLAHGACAAPELATTKAVAAVAGEYWDSSAATVAGEAPNSSRLRVGGGGGWRGVRSPDGDADAASTGCCCVCCCGCGSCCCFCFSGDGFF